MQTRLKPTHKGRTYGLHNGGKTLKAMFKLKQGVR